MDLQHIMEDKTFFYPNCCHVCKRWDVELINCAQCKMISYCNEEHQEQYWPQHKEICAAIKLVLEDKEYMNTEEISTEEWRNIRDAYSYKVSGILQRDLKIEEMQLFLFPKACVVCHRQDAVIQCNGCPSAAFCDKHRDESEHRVKYCELLRESFKAKNYQTSIEGIDISYVEYLSNEAPFCDMQSFLDTYVPLDKNDVYLRMLYSHKFTNPLTVYFGIDKLHFLNYKTLSIHMIGNLVLCFEEEFVLWEMLLILIPTLTTLTITFIQVVRMVSKCDISTEVLNVSETKKLVVNMRYMSYEEYVGTADFEKPDFIVGVNAIVANNSNAGIEYLDISKRSGAVLAEQKCPCILIFDYIDRVDEEMLHKIENCYFGINPFRSCMVHRHIILERPYCLNNYLIIFSDLDSRKVFLDRDNQSVLFSETTRE